MKKKITLKRNDCWELPFGVTCGCPLYKKMRLAGFAVNAIPDVSFWMDESAREHEFKPPFTESDYADLITKKKKSFSTMVSDED